MIVGRLWLWAFAHGHENDLEAVPLVVGLLMEKKMKDWLTMCGLVVLGIPVIVAIGYLAPLIALGAVIYLAIEFIREKTI